MFNNIKKDMNRYEELGGWLINGGFWVTLIYRYGSWLKKIPVLFLRFPLHLIYVLLVIPVRIMTHVYLPATVEIGEGFSLPHPNSIHIPPFARLGRGCTIYHEVTLGRGKEPGGPVLADNVVIFPGARVLDGITIGENSHIGTNAVVMRDVRAGIMMVSPPPRPIPINMTRQIKTDSCEKD